MTIWVGSKKVCLHTAFIITALLLNFSLTSCLYIAENPASIQPQPPEKAKADSAKNQTGAIKEKHLVPDDCKQLLLMITPNWNSPRGVLWRYERDDANQPWRLVGTLMEGVVGRKGLAWGNGLYDIPDLREPSDGPRKKEGDGKAPAGAFLLGSVFGSAPPEQMGALKMPYLYASESTICIDDSKSQYYNHIMDQTLVEKPDWRSFEHMRRSDELYRLGVIVEYNRKPNDPGKGSCVFIHIERNPTTGTAGCTAFAKPNVEILVQWLDEKKTPVLVQLPHPEYLRLRKNWLLPDIPDAGVTNQKGHPK